MDALDAIVKRLEDTTFSNRVWDYANGYRTELEIALQSGISRGVSADVMSRELRECLQYPDKLFRRVRDENGNLQFSNAARDFHPGQGVYRSSYMNARRLAATEGNIAYRTADYLRWQKLDFVVGINIEPSTTNHTCKGVKGVFVDICDELEGKYPKDFKWTGWHPHCRCHATPILKTEEELLADNERIMMGEEPSKYSSNSVNSMPKEFNDWVNSNADRILSAKQMPYFITDNNIAVTRAVDRRMLSIAEQYNQGEISENELAEFSYRYGQPFKKKVGVPDVQEVESTPEPYSMSVEDAERIMKEYDVTLNMLKLDAQNLVKEYNESQIAGIDLFKFEQAALMAVEKSGERLIRKGISFYNDYVEVKYYGSGDFEMIRMFKKEFGETIVVHEKLVLPKTIQKQGIGRAMFKTQLLEYERANVSRVELTANIDIGGYAWARYNFKLAKAYEMDTPKDFMMALQSKWERLMNSGTLEINEEEFTKIKDIICEFYKTHKDTDDFEMRLLTGYDWSKRLLSKENWKGVMKLKDSKAMAITKAYIGY